MFRAAGEPQGRARSPWLVLHCSEVKRAGKRFLLIVLSSSSRQLPLTQPRATPQLLEG